MFSIWSRAILETLRLLKTHLILQLLQPYSDCSNRFRTINSVLVVVDTHSLNAFDRPTNVFLPNMGRIF
jgi:hypothetical protein